MGKKRFISSVCEHPGISVQHKQNLSDQPASHGEEHDIFFLVHLVSQQFLGKASALPTPVTLHLLEIFVSLNPIEIVSIGKGKPHGTSSRAAMHGVAQSLPCGASGPATGPSYRHGSMGTVFKGESSVHC